MKKTGTYLLSLIVSVLLVFLLIASSAVLLVDINVSSTSLKGIASENKLESEMYEEIEKYYIDKYNTTGIPAEVYMNAISEEYIKDYEEAYIDSAFDALKNNTEMTSVQLENKPLEESIENFFNDFADENNYLKDDDFAAKLENTKKNAYTTVGSYCDVYKFSAMNNKGILKKLSFIYSRRAEATAALLGITVFMILILLFINRKHRIVSMYWLGISAIVSGIIGIVPSLWLVLSRYYDSFSIKQPAVFTAFTKAMYEYTEAFLAFHIALIVAGTAIVVIYGLIGDKKKYPDTKPTTFK